MRGINLSQSKIINNLNRLAMLTDSPSQEDPSELQQLLKENKMKELALKKATNLIQLLNIELEVEKNAHQQSLRTLQQELKTHYEHQIKKMYNKIEELELELKLRSQTSIDQDRTVRKPFLARIQSSRSTDCVKRKNSKSKTTILSFEEKEQPTIPNLKINNQLYRLQAFQFEEWRSTLMDEFDQIIKTEYDDLESLINRIENNSQEYRQIQSSPRKQVRNLHCQLSQTIRRQNTLINSFRAYAQDLEDLCKSIIFQLSSLNNRQFNEEVHLDLQLTLNKISGILSEKYQRWKMEKEELAGENQELHSILEGMVAYVKGEKGR